MGHNKGDNTNKHQNLTSSSKDPLQESPPLQETEQEKPPPVTVVTVTGASNFIPSASIYIPNVESVNPKRPRYTTGQWKLLPSPTQNLQQKILIMSTESTPQPPLSTAAAGGTSSDTATSSPTQLSRPSISAGESKALSEQKENQESRQFRKGKYVSPVWKPNEMLWLARAWRVHYQRGGSSTSDDIPAGSDQTASGRGKTRAEKDREVAEFLQKHGVNRDSKTAGTKWDNMLGEFRKVYEWERGEREQVGKSYFRLSPYERKLHRLPASFDEEVFEELSQFMGSKLRLSHRGGGSSIFSGIGFGGDDSRSSLTPTKSLPLSLPPLFRDEHELPLAGKSRQIIASGGHNEQISLYGSRGMGLLGFDSSSSSILEIGGSGAGSGSGPSSSSTMSKELRRIGKVRMVWEESVSLWGDENEHHRGRVKIEGCNFLNADELTFLDDSMVGCTMEAFENEGLRGFSVDKFFCGQQLKVFGRRKSSSTSSLKQGRNDRVQIQSTEPSIRSIPPYEYQDPTEYYIGCLRVPPQTLPTIFELPWHLQEPPPEELRFPVRKDIYRDLPQGKELFFTTSNEMLDSRAITMDLLAPITRSNPPITPTSRDSFIGLWDDCINRVISKFCSLEMVMVRKPPILSTDSIQDQWPNVTGFVRNFCLWRGEETSELREGLFDPSSTITEKLKWTFGDQLPYLLGYYAVGYVVTFCAFCQTPQERISRTDLFTLDLTSPSDRIKALVPCWRIACLLPLLADRISNSAINNAKQFPYSDFERIDLGGGNLIELTPNLMTRYFPSKRKWGAVKEIYDFLDQRIPHSEYIIRSSEQSLSLTFKPRGCRFKPENPDQLIEALKTVTKSLVALHDLSFMHRDLCWEKVMKRDGSREWFVTGFDEAVGAPQIYPHAAAASGRHAPEMGRGLHGVKVDVWGVGQLMKTSGLVNVPKMLKDLQNRCLDLNSELRPTAADCYHHLTQLQASLSAASAAGGGY